MAEQFSVVAGNATGARIGLADELIIGRSTPGLGNLGGDGEISRVHARVYRGQSGQLVIELGDCESMDSKVQSQGYGWPK